MRSGENRSEDLEQTTRWLTRAEKEHLDYVADFWERFADPVELKSPILEKLADEIGSPWSGLTPKKN